jgi:cell shape-determining protein MreC
MYEYKTLIIMVLLDSTAVANQASQFGVFEKLTDYGALGLIVLALGYVSWMFVQKKLKENEDLKKKIEELREELLKSKLSK